MPASSRSAGEQVGFRIGVSYSKELGPGPFDGRMLLILSDNDRREPRFEVSSRNDDAQPIFGMDVEDLEPGQEAVFDAGVFGFPVDTLAKIPPGEYVVQALLHKYETFHRADGHTVKLPMDRGEGQMWNIAPGNLLSTPRSVRIDPSKPGMIHVTLDKVIPPFPEEKDTKYIKHIKIQSRAADRILGPPDVPRRRHPPALRGSRNIREARYPLMVYQGHFSRTFDTLVGFREEAPPLTEQSENASAPRRLGRILQSTTKITATGSTKPGPDPVSRG